MNSLTESFIQSINLLLDRQCLSPSAKEPQQRYGLQIRALDQHYWQRHDLQLGHHLLVPESGRAFWMLVPRDLLLHFGGRPRNSVARFQLSKIAASLRGFVSIEYCFRVDASFPIYGFAHTTLPAF